MIKRMRVTRALLWLYVILLGIEIGAGLYEARVWVPLWADSPPESAWFWEDQRTANPQYAPDAGRRFWIFATPSVGLVAIATLIAGLKARGEQRKWLLASTILTVVVVVATFAWFVPTVVQVMNSRRLGLGAEELTAKAQLWVTLNWVRAAVYLAAWLAGLRALTASPTPE